jgi:hypothetical protein
VQLSRKTISSTSNNRRQSFISERIWWISGVCCIQVPPVGPGLKKTPPSPTGGTWVGKMVKSAEGRLVICKCFESWTRCRANLSPGARFAMKTKNEPAVNEIEMREASESHAWTARFDNQLLFIYFTWRKMLQLFNFHRRRKCTCLHLFCNFSNFFNFAAKFSKIGASIISNDETFKFDLN